MSDSMFGAHVTDAVVVVGGARRTVARVWAKVAGSSTVAPRTAERALFTAIVVKERRGRRACLCRRKQVGQRVMLLLVDGATCLLQAIDLLNGISRKVLSDHGHRAGDVVPLTGTLAEPPAAPSGAVRDARRKKVGSDPCSTRRSTMT